MRERLPGDIAENTITQSLGFHEKSERKAKHPNGPGEVRTNSRPHWNGSAPLFGVLFSNLTASDISHDLMSAAAEHVATQVGPNTSYADFGGVAEAAVN